MSNSADTPVVLEDVKGAIAENPVWYHTIEVAPGLVTPGWFDLRPVVERMPWPDVKGKRCLDVGTYDGYLAFELERRGASEVVATDVLDHENWDWPARIKGQGVLALNATGEKGMGFRLAKEILGSKAERRVISVYDLSPEEVGTFDVVVCGSLLLHLRDPLRALEGIRSVCTGQFMSSEQVELWTSVLLRRRPLLRVDGVSQRLNWLLPNVAAHEQMILAAGFDIERRSGMYGIPLGTGHRDAGKRNKEYLQLLGRRLFAGGQGMPHHAVLARPAA